MIFKEWIQLSKELLEVISLLPEDFAESTGQYNSNHFSFLYNPITKSCTYKLYRSYTEITTSSAGVHQHTISPGGYQITSPGSTGQITIAGPYTTGTGTIYPRAPTSSFTHTSSEDKLAQVSCTIKDGKLLDLKFISKSSYTHIALMSHDMTSEDGGKLLFSTLYLGDSKIMVNGKIYDIDNSPEAFNEDLVNEDGVSILDLAEMRHVYELQTK